MSVALWDGWHQAGGPIFPHEKVIQFFFRHFPPERRNGVQVLDLGCGSGVHTVFLAQEGCRVTGVDYSPVAIANTRAKLAALQLTAALEVTPLDQIEFPDASFDLVVCVSVLEAAGPAVSQSAVARLRRLLAPGAKGLFVFASDRDCRILGNNPYGLYGYTSDEVRQLFACAFPKVWLDRYITTYQGGALEQNDHLVTFENQPMPHPFDDDFQQLAVHYTELYQRYGDSPKASQWSDRPTQERRLEILAQVGDLSTAKILDVGCGTGHLLTYLRQHCQFVGAYAGYDLSAGVVAAAAAKHPGGRFEVRDVLSAGVPERFDYILISGIFNNRVKDNWGALTAMLRCLFAHADRALAFNLLSTHVDFTEPHLYYADPAQVFRFCKEELSPLVCLRHDYQLRPNVVPYEFTVYVRRGA